MSIPAFSVRHSVVANMITIFVIVAGIFVTMTKLNREVFPTTDLNLVIVRTIYPDASASEVEDLITNPIEEQIREVEEIDEYSSSSQEGGSFIVVKIDLDTKNVDRVINDIQRKVELVDDLPEDAEDPIVESLTTAQPIIRVCVNGDVDETLLRSYADSMKSKLERIPGVSSVARDGWRDEEFSVELDPDLLLEKEVSFDEVRLALARRNINLPGGKIPVGDEEMLVRTIGKFYNEAEISKVVIRSNADGKFIQVSDVADVQRQFAEDTVVARINGKPTIILKVKKGESGDVIDIVNDVRQLVDAETEFMPDGIGVTLVDDTSYYVKRRLTVLLNNGWVGMVLVTLFLFIFLNGRVAFFTALGIPFAFLTTLLAMAFFGLTINLMTMFGLIIVLGMVVDDAIIVGENIARRIEGGEPPVEAASNGGTEVMKPVISTVLTSIAAFLPLIFAPDLFGTYLSWLVYIVVIALSASLLECLVILPAHLADIFRISGHMGTHHERKHKLMNAVQGFYRWSMRSVLKHRYIFLLITGIVFAGLVSFSTSRLRVEIFPADLIDIFLVQIETPEGTQLSRTDELTAEVQKRVAALPTNELQNVVTIIGAQFALDNTGADTGTHMSQLFVYLTPQETRDRPTQAIMDDLRQQAAEIEGLERIEFETVKPGPPAGKPLEVKIAGPDFTVSKKIAEEIKAFLAGVEGVADIEDDMDRGKEELRVTVKEQEAARLGLGVQQIAQTVFSAFSGFEATVVREGKEEIDVKVRLPESLRTVEQLRNLQVRNASGRLIDLHRVVSFSRERGLPAIAHSNGDRIITVSASVDTEVISATKVNYDLEQAFRDTGVRYPGYSLVPSGEWKETKKIIDFMYVALIVSVLLIASIMVIQFNSFIQPLYIVVTIPLGVIGVLIALILHDKPLSMMAMMGMVGLGGVVVNDAIVLVTFINNRLRDSADSVFEAVLEAGSTRIRPILLTSVTTIAGLMPTIYGWGGYEPFIIPAAIALAYGLLFATFLTLAVVPTVYLVGDDIQNLVKRIFNWVTRGTFSETTKD